MANSPHIKRVLYSYKVQAMDTLQGPGTNLKIEHHKLIADQAAGYSFKKAFIYDSYKRANENSCKKCDVEIVQVPMQLKCPPDATPWHTTITPCIDNKLSPLSEKPLKKDQTDIILIKSDPAIKKPGVENSEIRPHNWGDPSPGVGFFAPSQPPKPLPVLASADPGVLPLHGRSETYLDGEPIACFYIGGEPRLCLPQVLNTVLRNFTLTQIYAFCDELQIFCSRCTPMQLDYLKDTGVLPPSATSCGLITKTDAQRLTHALMFSIMLRPAPAHLNPDKHPHIRVCHNCFGKCKALVWPDLYTSPTEPCIECLECRNMFTPMQFVCHVHTNLENRTCHWGFDADNWRSYLMLAKEQNQPLNKDEVEFQAFKNKFDSANHKRKQNLDVKDDAKKVRGEGLYSNCDPNCYMPWGNSCNSPLAPPWALVTKDGKHYPPPPPTFFIKESIPSSIPEYLSQGPPVLLDSSRVVPLSESEKFERNFQPNLALAPLKARDKIESSEKLSDEELRIKPRIKSPPKQFIFKNIVLDGLDDVKIKSESAKDELIVVKIELDSVQKIQDSAHKIQDSAHKIQDSAHKIRIHQVDEDLHPDLELSTTDSDTESVNSVTSKSEVVEEAEALLRGWTTDRAAAKKVLDIVASLARNSFEKDKKLGEASKEKARLQYSLHMYKKEQGARHKIVPDEEVLQEKLSASDLGFQVKKEP